MTDMSKLLKAYNITSNLVNETGYLTQDFSKIESIFEEKKQNPNVSIMVYGVYNAGKSTLINALAGEEVAEVADIPKTDKTTEYQCGAFKILDTPGIDAPIEHEEVAKDQLVKADAVIFVVNPMGVAEEQRTLDELLKLVKDGKKVFLVFNEKNKLKEEDYIHLKEQTYKILQEMATKYGMDRILNKIPISKINAKTALKGRLENKHGLLQSSGFTAFEKELNDFINSISDDDVAQRLKTELSGFLEKLIQFTEDQVANNNVVGQYDKLICKVTKEKALVKKGVENQITRSTKELQGQVRSWLNSNNQNFERSLNDWIEKRVELIFIKFSTLLESASTEIQNHISDLEAKLPSPLNGATIDIQSINIDSENAVVPVNNGDTGFKFDTAELTGVATVIATQIKVEHIVVGLQALKSMFPELMKGIGIKTMEKVAGQFIVKAIPMVGAVITMGSALYDMFSEDEQTAKLRQEHEAYKRAQERRDQQIEDASQQVASQFETSVTLDLNKATDQFFAEITNQLRKIANEFSDKERQNSFYLQKAQEAKQLIN